MNPYHFPDDANLLLKHIKTEVSKIVIKIFRLTKIVIFKKRYLCYFIVTCYSNIILHFYRCVWQSRSGDRMIPVKEITSLNQEDDSDKAKTNKLPRIKLPLEIMRKLRQLSMRPPPQLRPSIR